VVEHTMDVSGWLRKQREEASAELLRVMVKEMAEALMSADADAVCDAGYGERSPERVNPSQRLPRARLARGGTKWGPSARRYLQTSPAPISAGAGELMGTPHSCVSPLGAVRRSPRAVVDCGSKGFGSTSPRT
jgi:hypothetical protein